MKAEPRLQSLGEEIANAVSHGIGFLMAVASLPILLVKAAPDAGALHLVALCVFSITMMSLYLASCLYHALPSGRIKEWFCRFDHAAIFLFIAGSYTPFMLGVLRGGTAEALLAVVWTIATLGVFAKMTGKLRHPFLSTGLYVGMGWLALFVVGPLVEKVPAIGLAWIVGGGLMYTIGAVVFHFDDRLRYAHFVWHLFVLLGSACHFAAVLHYSR